MLKWLYTNIINSIYFPMGVVALFFLLLVVSIIIASRIEKKENPDK